MAERWKTILGFERYEVSDAGRVRNAQTGRILRQDITIWGYARVTLYARPRVPAHKAVHRLVAGAFLGESDLSVNHKNEIKTDNRVENLEYMTCRDNCNYGTRNEKLSRANKAQAHLWARSVAQIEPSTQYVIAVYPSRLEAERQTGINNGRISKCCRGERKTAGGFEWRNV